MALILCSHVCDLQRTPRPFVTSRQPFRDLSMTAQTAQRVQFSGPQKANSMSAMHSCIGLRAFQLQMGNPLAGDNGDIPPEGHQPMLHWLSEKALHYSQRNHQVSPAMKSSLKRQKGVTRREKKKKTQGIKLIEGGTAQGRKGEILRHLSQPTSQPTQREERRRGE